MKKNLLKIILDTCDQDKLLTALSMVDEETITKIVYIATGDTILYNNNTLPKLPNDVMYKCIVRNYRYDKSLEEVRIDDIVSVNKISVENFCLSVRVNITYKRYKTIKVLKKEENSDIYSYTRGKYIGNEMANIWISVDEWMDTYFKVINSPFKDKSTPFLPISDK